MAPRKSWTVMVSLMDCVSLVGGADLGVNETVSEVATLHVSVAGSLAVSTVVMMAVSEVDRVLGKVPAFLE